jgi:hypothetical protein
MTFATYRATSGVPARSPLAWLNDLGVRRRDLAPFGADLRTGGSALLAIHRDAAGIPLGTERVTVGRDARLRYSYTPGKSRGLFRAIPPGARRLVIADGPLPAVAAAALESAEEPTAYAGGWGEVAAAAVRRLVESGATTCVVLRFAATPVGVRTLERALHDLAGLAVPVMVAPPPRETWLASLAAARGARGPL